MYDCNLWKSLNFQCIQVLVSINIQTEQYVFPLFYVIFWFYNGRGTAFVGLLDLGPTNMSILNKFSSTATATANTRSSYTSEDLGQLIPKLVSMVTTLCEQREVDRKELQRRFQLSRIPKMRIQIMCSQKLLRRWRMRWEK